MPEIVLNQITKKFGKTKAVDNLSLTIKDKEFVTLLGPSGCGKTTTLRMIAGLETPTEGEIYIDGELVFSAEKGIDLSPVKRNVGFLFQNYALWPHMTVYKNITFGLENLKWKKADMNKRVDELATLLKIEKYLERYPSELSGGQQQRVAIARTLAPNPKILFMDEPLSNLDAKLRMDMRSELKRIHMDTDSTFVYVTHDQLEAMTLSSRISLFNEGKLQQYSSPLEIYNYPVNTFAGDFVGNPPMNIVDVTVLEVNGEGVHLDLNQNELIFTTTGKADLKKGQHLKLGIRPEQIEIINSDGIDGHIYSSLPSGLETVFKVDVLGLILTCITFCGKNFDVGAKINIGFTSDKNILFSEDGMKMASGSLQVIS